MLKCRIRPLLVPTFFARDAPKSVTVIIRKTIWTNQLKQQNAENEKFLALFPDVVASFSNHETLKIFPEVGEFVKKLLEYNSTGGKKVRGLMTVTAYQMLEEPENITEESLRLARILGWCVELTILQITIGQHLEAVSARNISHFTEKNYINIAKFKTTFYTFKLPVYMSLILANKSYEGVYKNEEDLLHQMSILTSMQNDYMDCFGDETEFGKAGTDIQEGKCTWLAVQALARCAPAQREELAACYGAPDAARARRVKRLYEQLQLPALYRDAERAAYDNIVKRINAIPTDNVIPPALLRMMFHLTWDSSIKL